MVLRLRTLEKQACQSVRYVYVLEEIYLSDSSVDTQIGVDVTIWLVNVPNTQIGCVLYVKHFVLCSVSDRM